MDIQIIFSAILSCIIFIDGLMFILSTEKQLVGAGVIITSIIFALLIVILAVFENKKLEKKKRYMLSLIIKFLFFSVMVVCIILTIFLIMVKMAKNDASNVFENTENTSNVSKKIYVSPPSVSKSTKNIYFKANKKNKLKWYNPPLPSSSSSSDYDESITPPPITPPPDLEEEQEEQLPQSETEIQLDINNPLTLSLHDIDKNVAEQPIHTSDIDENQPETDISNVLFCTESKHK